MDFSLGILDLGQVPQWQVWNFDWSDSSAWLPLLLLFFLPVISGGVQFISAAIMRKTNPMATPAEGTPGAGSMGTVMKLMPLMSVVFGFMFPAALAVYWTAGTALQIGQDLWLNKKYTKILDEEDAERDKIRKAKEAELEAKRLETERKKAEGILEENKNRSKRKKQKGDKQAQREKAAEWEKKNAPEKPVEKKSEPGRVGNRKYARGRAYNPHRYKRKGHKSAEVLVEDNEDVETDLLSEKADVAIDVEYNEVDSELDDDNVASDYEDSDDDDSEDYENDEDGDFEDEDDYEGDDEGDDDEDDFEDDDDDLENGGEDESSSESPPTTRFDTKRFDEN